MSKTIYTERQLLQRAAAGDETAFASLFHLYKNSLYSYLLRLSGSADLAEDIIQEVFLQLWDHRQSLDQVQQFRAYIFRAAQHRIINAFRRQSKEMLILAELRRVAPDTSSDNAEEELTLDETRQRLLEAINKLSPQQKAVYTLSREHGLQHEEIARRLHISRSTVNNHLIRALQVLRNHLGWLGSFL